MDAKLKHLEMIQGVINRMASNSFLFKGWSITIIAAISAFASNDNDPVLMLIPLASTLLFWAVDAYYLMMERAFRELYKDVTAKDSKAIDFEMSVSDKGVSFTGWLRTLRRPILVSFYGTVLVMLGVLISLLNNVRIEIIFQDGS